jgi:hypothetical protein
VLKLKQNRNSEKYNASIDLRIKERIFWSLKAVIFLMMAGLCLQTSGCTTLSGDNTRGLVEETEQSGIEEEWGVRIRGVRLTAAGYMLDFRYQVLNPEKAAPLLKSKVKPYLIDQTSGAKLVVPNLPKVGALRQRSVRSDPDWTSFVLFSNPGKLVKQSGLVTVVIGNLRIEDLVVE